MSRSLPLLAVLAASGAGLAAPALADGTGPTTNDQPVPNVLIVQVPEVGDSGDLTDQATDTDVEVYPLAVELTRHDDGTFDMDAIRTQILELIAETQPIKVKVDTPDATFAGVSADVQTLFNQAEADSVAANDEGSKPAVAWRGYGPAGASRGVIAYSRSPYRGYYPYRWTPEHPETIRWVGNPYYGYYAHGRNYPFAYAAHRVTPSYHYFGYVRSY